MFLFFFFFFFTYFFFFYFFFFSSRRRHTRLTCDWSSDVCSSDLPGLMPQKTTRKPGASTSSSTRPRAASRSARVGEDMAMNVRDRLLAHVALGHFSLAGVDPSARLGVSRGRAERALAKDARRLAELQDRLHAEGRRSLLVVLQGMDT